jgi:alpha-glucosidase
MLLLGSHDTGRIRTVLGGDPDRLQLAFAILLTYPGVPSIFYGDEIGLEGAGSLEARRTMPWDEAGWDTDLLETVRKLVHARRTLPALVRGGFQLLDRGDEWFAYARETDEDVAIVVASRTAGEPETVDVTTACLPDGLRLRDLLDGDAATVERGHIEGRGNGSVRVWYARR